MLYTNDSPRIVVDYNSCLSAPLDVVERLAAFLEADEPSQLRQSGAAFGEFVAPDLRHHKTGSQELLKSGLSSQVKELYFSMLEISRSCVDPDKGQN